MTRRLMSLAKIYFNPLFSGLESQDPCKPALLVGNHTLYGLLDVPFLLEHMFERYGVVVRSLGDRAHFAVPVWREFLAASGTVLGTPENCDALMKRGETILVFPGGSREVMRRKNEQYQLIWKNRLGFVRMAIKHGYDILPFASLGADECFTIMADADDYQRNTWLRQILEHPRIMNLSRAGEVLPPLVRGVGFSIVPRPQRFYFGFAPRISTAEYEGQEHDKDALWNIRRQVAESIHSQMTQLEFLRRRDRAQNWSWLRRRLTEDANRTVPRLQLENRKA